MQLKGKSLSIIIGACEWLMNHENNLNFLLSLTKNEENISNQKKSKEKHNDLPDWLVDDNLNDELAREILIKELNQKKKSLEKKRELFKIFQKNKILIKNQKNYIKEKKNNIDEEDFIDYESDVDELDVDKIFANLIKKRNLIKKEKFTNFDKDEDSNFKPIKVILYKFGKHPFLRLFMLLERILK